MSLSKSVAIIIGFLFAIVTADPSKITNVQFTDDNGNNYDLFELLDRGTHVYIELVDNN